MSPAAKRTAPDQAMPTYYLATLDAKYELSACATTPREALRLLHKAWKDWWRNDDYGGDRYTWKEHLEGGSIQIRALVPGANYVDGDGRPYEPTAPAWCWSACDTTGLPDASYGTKAIR